jgi:YesN/AraC family two-component response regulator
MTITQEHFTNPDLSISAIADGIGYDTKYISALFKRRTGGAYTTFLRELRIKHAVFLMEEGVTSVKNVAILSGFRDPLYFSKVFAGSVGMSPKAYIQSIEERKKENK